MSPTIHRTQLDYRAMACNDKRIIGPSRKTRGWAENKGRRRAKVKGSCSMRSRKLGWIVVAGGVALGCISTAYGSAVPIAYETQDRSVSANSMASGLTRGGTNTTPTTDTQSQSQQANGFGVFGGNASVTPTLGPDSALATASASQQSSLNVNEIDASGAVRADSALGLGVGPASSSATTVFHITFDVA